MFALNEFSTLNIFLILVLETTISQKGQVNALGLGSTTTFPCFYLAHCDLCSSQTPCFPSVFEKGCENGFKDWILRQKVCVSVAFQYF